MITRKQINEDLVPSLVCKGCNDTLDEIDLQCYDDFEGLCEECYGEAMESAYEDYEGEV